MKCQRKACFSPLGNPMWLMRGEWKGGREAALELSTRSQLLSKETERKEKKKERERVWASFAALGCCWQLPLLLFLIPPVPLSSFPPREERSDRVSQAVSFPLSPFPSLPPQSPLPPLTLPLPPTLLLHFRSAVVVVVCHCMEGCKYAGLPTPFPRRDKLEILF